MLKARVLIPFTALIAFLITCEGANPLHVLAVGMVAPGSSPLPGWLQTEPTTAGTLVPNRYAVGVFDLEDAKRMVRIYFPRTSGRLSNYDIIVFSGGCIRGFTSPQVAMITSAVSGGMAAITDIGGVSSSAELWNEWLASSIDVLFPNDVTAVTSAGKYRDEMPFKIEVSNSPDLGDVLRTFVPLGIEQVVGMNAYRMIPLPGSKVWAVTRGNWPELEQRPPWLMSWKYGKGFTWAIADAFTFDFWSSYERVITGESRSRKASTNPYALDIFMNLIFEATGRQLPEDILLVHQVRQNLRVYQDVKSTMYDIMNLLEQFGANTNSLNKIIQNIDAKRNLAEEAYLSQDYTAAEGFILEALDGTNTIRDGVEKLRNRTMFWVFLTEWSAVSATLMVAGTLIYWLMIRRRLYREVPVTRKGE